MELPKKLRHSLKVAAALIALYLCAGLIYVQKYMSLENTSEYSAKHDYSSQKKELRKNTFPNSNSANQNSPNEMTTRTVTVIKENEADPIHLALSISKETEIESFYTLIKNILYYRGRFRFNQSECQMKILTIRNELCPITELSTNDSLCLHLLVTDRVKEIISNTFHVWKPEDVEVFFYDFGEYKTQILYLQEPTEEKVYNDRGEEIKMTNLLWPEIIRPSVTKVIVLDTDMLLNQNIATLWNMFTDFGVNQFIGGVFEQTTYLKNLMEAYEFRTLNTGVNTGMLLLDLEKMREISWSELWTEVAKKISKKWNKFPFGDQVIFNYIIHSNPAYFHEIPCEWNYVIFGQPNQDDCPVVWMIQHAHKQYCPLSDWYSFKGLVLAGLVHHISDRSSYLETIKPVRSVRRFTVREMEQTFQEVYSAFKQLNYQCFTRIVSGS